jgi:hypothetical protein
MSLVDTADYGVWDDDAPIVHLDVLDQLTDDEIITLPADVLCEVIERYARGGLVVEDGDRTASIEILRRIPISEMTAMDFCATWSPQVIAPLDDTENPYCVTTFSSQAIPPRIEEPRLPKAPIVSLEDPSSRLGDLRGIERCLSNAIHAVQLQKRYYGDWQFLASYYSHAYGLPFDYFDRPVVDQLQSTDVARLIANRNQQSYINYTDPAWQAVVGTTRPVLDEKSFGVNSIIHWNRLYYLARLQYEIGILDMGQVDMAIMYDPLVFRVAAHYVHHFDPRCHGAAFGPFGDDDIPPDLPPKLERLILEGVADTVNRAWMQALQTREEGLLLGQMGRLTWVAHTQLGTYHPTAGEINAVVRKLPKFHYKPRVVQMGDALRAFMSLLGDESALFVDAIEFVELAFQTVCVIIDIPGVELIPSRRTDYIKNLGKHLLSHVRVHVFAPIIAAVRGDTIRDRATDLLRIYAEQLPQDARIPDGHHLVLYYMHLYLHTVVLEAMKDGTKLYKVDPGHKTYWKQLKGVRGKLRSGLHNGVTLLPPHVLAQKRRFSTKSGLRLMMLRDMQTVYGMMLNQRAITQNCLTQTYTQVPVELNWSLAMALARYHMLGAIQLKESIESDSDWFKVSTDLSAIRRALINVAMRLNLPNIKTGWYGSVDVIWNKLRSTLPTHGWCNRQTVYACKIGNIMALHKWLEDMLKMHRADQEELTAAICEIKVDEEAIRAQQRAIAPVERVKDKVNPFGILDMKVDSLPPASGVSELWTRVYTKVYSTEAMEELDAYDYNRKTSDDIRHLMEDIDLRGFENAWKRFTGWEDVPEIR